MRYLKRLGLVDVERFISLMLKEHFDYTKWQKDLFEDEDIETLGNKGINMLVTKNKKIVMHIQGL